MPYQEIVRIIQRPEVQREIFIDRREMSIEELHKAALEREAVIRGMKEGGKGLLDGLDKFFGDIDPELKEAIDRARAMGRFR